MRDELIDVAKAVLADLPLFECQSFHHRPEDRHTSFDCPVLARFCANVAKMREALRTPRPESQDGEKDAVDHEREALREVYEHARGYLRHAGIDGQRAAKSFNLLRDWIEVVKEIDGGNYDPSQILPAMAAPPKERP